MRFWDLSHSQAAKAQTRLCICNSNGNMVTISTCEHCTSSVLDWTLLGQDQCVITMCLRVHHV